MLSSARLVMGRTVNALYVGSNPTYSAKLTGCSSVCLERLIWDQKAES